MGGIPVTQHAASPATAFECAQVATIEGFGKSLQRVESHLSNVNSHMERSEEHMRRTAVALENIAAQGVLINTHENRLTKHDSHFEELFGRVRVIESVHAKDEGIEEIEEKKEKFWSEMKLKLVTPALTGLFFLLWILDRSEFFVKVATLWKEFK